MSGAEAALAGSGVQSTIGRFLNTLSGSFVPSATDPEIQAADRVFESLNALAARFTRDLTGSSRLSGVAELHTVLEQFPKNQFNYSQTENITKLMGLHDNLMKAKKRTAEIRLDPKEQYSPEARKEAEALGITVESMLELVGTKEELEEALAKARKDPKGWSRVWAQIGNAFSGAPEELARMRQESSAIQGGDLSGMDPLDFEDLLGDVVEKAKVNPQDPDLIPDEVIDKLSDEQERMLIEAIQGVLQPQAAPRQ